MGVGQVQETDAPDQFSYGEVYERLIEDVCGDDVVRTLTEVYSSWIDDAISNYNSDFFYQPRDYIRECYLEGGGPGLGASP